MGSEMSDLENRWWREQRMVDLVNEAVCGGVVSLDNLRILVDSNSL